MGYKSTKEVFEPGHKRCSKCKDVKSIDLFDKCRSGRFGVAGYCSECRLSRQRKYNEKPEVISKRKVTHANWRETIKHTEQFRARNTMSNKLRRVLKYQWMSPETEKLMGCTAKEFINHLSSQFVEGMTFENYGDWQLDHILPTSRFNLVDNQEARICYHYSNIRPMWEKANMDKKDKIEKGTEQISLPI